MKKNIMQYMSGLAFALLAMASCSIHEDLDACYTLRLKVENVKGDDITALSAVTDASLYIFDENLNFLETRSLEKDFIANREVIMLDYPEDTKLHIVAWGNLGGGKENISKATKAEELKVMLKTQEEVAQSPDSLFFGSKEVVTRGTGVAGGNQEIVIVPKIGTVTMETQGLPYALGARGLKATGDCDFYMNRTLSAFDYTGRQTGDSVYYNPEGMWDRSTASEWVTTEAQTLCEGQNMSGTIYVGGKLIQEVTEGQYMDGTSGPIEIYAERNTHVIFQWGEDGAFLGAKIIVTPWGYVEDNSELKPVN
ncbi:FimB/Mfa2 family fimbrial subunit [uncultured Parabacteroides sp.]|uniref:FimB/Mfa2 family fimbrial subunit n=1 Tax=uncultured Parabacteroides sp. TaxID=512312 RepID=UPI0026218DC0|nr:FimB/Mfa2 family fimbrial subunit [uncultured Parabacteroides sp.]